MESIDFGCQVRCLNRQKLIPGSTSPQLNQCASKFLAKVRKEVASTPPVASTASDAKASPDMSWMKLKLSERGLRILPTSSSSSSSSSASSCSSSSEGVATVNTGPYSLLNHRRSDEGFESDSEQSDHRSSSLQPRDHAHHSGGSSSGVNSSSSDIDETELSMASTSSRSTNLKKKAQQHFERMLPIRCELSDILSCQHPPALGRHVVLLTLRSADDAALDILALECSAEEPARILTLLCQKIAASPSLLSSGASLSSATSHSSSSKKSTTSISSSTTTATSSNVKSNSGSNNNTTNNNNSGSKGIAKVSIQSWSEREKMLDALIDSTRPSGAQSIIRQLERQHSEWNLIQRRTDDGLTHLQVSQKNAATSSSSHNIVVGIRNAATTSGAPLLKKGMPSGGSFGQLARLETALAITSNHPNGRLIGGGGGGIGADHGGVSQAPPVAKKHVGLRRSDTMQQKLPKSSSVATSSTSVSFKSTKSSSSCILSLQTPELPLSPSVTGLSPTGVSNASTSTADAPAPPATKSRWSFGAPFRQHLQQQQHQAVLHHHRPVSPETSRRSDKSRGRSCERKSSKLLVSSSKSLPHQPELDSLFVTSSGSNNNSSSSSNSGVCSSNSQQLNGNNCSSSNTNTLSSNHGSNNKGSSNNKSNSSSKSSRKQQQSEQKQQTVLPAISTPSSTTKIKRDPSKTRSFLMKLTSRKTPSPPAPTPAAPSPPPPASTLSLGTESTMTMRANSDLGGSSSSSDVHQHPARLQQRGRSLVRLRSTTRLQSPPPPLSTSSSSSSSHTQTFLIPTKSGAELTRNIYPKEGLGRFGSSGPASVVVGSVASAQQPPPPPPPQPVFHLLTTANGAAGVRPTHQLHHHRYSGPVTAPTGWASYCWANDALRHPMTFSPSDANNNQQVHQQIQQQLQQQQQQQHQQQQQWIYFHPHPIAAVTAAPPPPPPTAALLTAGDLKRMQRSRSQSPGRRASQRWIPGPPAAAVGHYYAMPSGPPSLPQPVSLPPDMCHVSRAKESSRSFRRSKSSTRMSGRHLTSKSERLANNNNNNKAVTFHAFATVQLVD